MITSDPETKADLELEKQCKRMNKEGNGVYTIHDGKICKIGIML